MACVTLGGRLHVEMPFCDPHLGYSVVVRAEKILVQISIQLHGSLG